MPEPAKKFRVSSLGNVLITRFLRKYDIMEMIRMDNNRNERTD